MTEDRAFIPKFNEKQEAFLIWWTCFKNYAMVKQLGQVVSNVLEGELPAAWNTVLSLADAREKRQIEAR